MLGRVLGGFELLEVLGAGGMARVYRAHHERLPGEHAVKVLYGELACDRTYVTRFEREAHAMQTIKHDNVVSVTGSGRTDEGIAFMAMERLRGAPLNEILRDKGALPASWAATIAQQIAAGLDAAHRLGFVHRDLKPSNTMLVSRDGQGWVKLLDFGLVRKVEALPHEDLTQLTRTGQVFGTPAYMAPEQLSGQKVDARADLYALGVMLHEMLSGRKPFVGASPLVAAQQLLAAPPTLPSSLGLEALAQRLLEKHPDHRLASAAAVIGAIRTLDVAAPIDASELALEVPAAASGPSSLSTVSGPVVARPLDAPLRPPTRAVLPRARLWLGAVASSAIVGGAFVLGFELPAVLSTEGGVDGSVSVETPAPRAGAPVAERAMTASPTPDAILVGTDVGATPPDAGTPPRHETKPRPVGAKPRSAAAQHRRRARKRSKSISRGSFRKLDRKIDRALAARGLRHADLGLLRSPAAARWGAWRRQPSAPNASALRATFRELAAVIKTVSISGRIVGLKLDRIGAQLEKVDKSHRTEEFVALEDEWIRLRRSRRVARDPDALASVARKASDLEDRLRRALRGL